MPAIEPKTLRFLALLSAPLFTLLSQKLGITVPLEVQEMLVGTVALYILGSHGKEAIVQRAKVAGEVAGKAVVVNPDAGAVVDGMAGKVP